VNNLLKLIDCGQSYWLDNLTRDMIESGELEQRVVEQGLRGITSNPDIFEKAISKSHAYDGQIQQLSGHGYTVEHVYEALVIKDIQDACDIMLPVYHSSNGLDGYVSLEVSPHLAHQAAATLTDARRLYSAVGRPNCMIKIPGTPEGLIAVEEMLYEGINTNITLLFSVKVYEEVAHTYIRALERRHKEGKPLQSIASVASFFLSRIDVLLDKQLDKILSEGDSPRHQQAKGLLGQIAVANAKWAYQSFKEIFNGDRWKQLHNAGARVQRPLWASTSTKNPNYRDVMYVEPLVGQHTVNTMPDVTIAAYATHGKLQNNAIEQDVGVARQQLAALADLGIDLEAATSQLTIEGIQKFITPFDTLLATVTRKIEQQGLPQR
jgi:transaldolase